MAPSEITLVVHPPREQTPFTEAANHRWPRVDGSPWMERYDSGAKTLLRIPGLADFAIDGAGAAVETWPVPGLDQEACRQLYLNNVLPMVLSRQGKLVLHASAVDVGGSAMVFIGVSGRGKSTLATSLARCGYPLIADDGLVIEIDQGHPMAMPGDQSVRLWQDSQKLLDHRRADTGRQLGYTEKQQFLASESLRFCTVPRPIQSIFLLGDDRLANLAIRKLSPALALVELMHYSFLLDVGNARRHAALMHAASMLSSTTGVSVLDYPRDYNALPLVHEAILKNNRGAGAIQ